jgi:hypothetical protein
MVAALLIPASFLFFLSGVSNQAEIRGHVVTEAGEPVRFVEADSLREAANGKLTEIFGITGMAGEFQIKKAGKILFVEKPGFMSAIRVLGPEDNDVTLVLKRQSPEAHLRFSKCADSKTGIPAGFAHLLPLPEGVTVQQEEHGIDTGRYVIAFPQRNAETMTVLSGMYKNSPRLAVVRESSSIQQRKIEGWGAEDIQGKLKNGKRWRWVNLEAGWLMYYDASPKAAAFFDSVIDRTCELPQAPPWLSDTKR